MSISRIATRVSAVVVAAAFVFAGIQTYEAVAGTAMSAEAVNQSEQQAAKAKLTRVEAKKVCMINEEVFERDQIPVEVNGKTYYGCCDMCTKALTREAARRIAIDPISGAEVDKADAVIGADEDGNVVYFENEETFRQYNEQ
jgi:YHS domain-containing protein